MSSLQTPEFEGHHVQFGAEPRAQVGLAKLTCNPTVSTALVGAWQIRDFDYCPFCAAELPPEVFE